MKRELATVPLFPELTRYKTVADRVADRDATEAAFRHNMRSHRAQLWRQVRKLLRALPPITRLGVLLYWSRGTCPDDPVYLLTIIKEAGHRSPWRRLRELKLIRMIGQVTDATKRADLVRQMKEAA